VDLRREAVRLRNELESTFRVAARIRWGGLGELTVLVDGRPVFSRRQAGRLPQPGEIVRIVQALG
jgi:hypothetical protein